MIAELVLEDEVAYRDFFRVNKNRFQRIVEAVGPSASIEKQDTVMRDAIKPDERLAITPRFLVTGEAFTSLQWSFRYSRTIISEIVMEVCDAITAIMGPELLKTPSTTEEWMAIANEFGSRWNFPNGIGAIDEVQ